MDSDATLAASLFQKRVLRSRRGGPGVGGSGIGSCDIDNMILNTQTRPELESVVPADTLILFKTDDKLDRVAAELCIAGSSAINVTARDTYFDRPDVIKGYRDQLVIETPDFEQVQFVAGRLRVRVNSDDPLADADAIYEKRHRKFEAFEKRQRLREKEKLKHEQYKLKERIDQLRAMDNSAFLAAPASWFSARPNVPPDIIEEDLSNNMTGTSPQQYAEGERRRREMLVNAQSLEERYRVLLPPDQRWRKNSGLGGNNLDGDYSAMVDEGESEFEEPPPPKKDSSKLTILLKRTSIPSNSTPTTPKPTPSVSKKRRRTPPLSGVLKSPAPARKGGEALSVDHDDLDGDLDKHLDKQAKSRSKRPHKRAKLTDDREISPPIDVVSAEPSPPADEAFSYPLPPAPEIERPISPAISASGQSVNTSLRPATPPPKSPSTSSYRGDSVSAVRASLPPIESISAPVGRGRGRGRPSRGGNSAPRKSATASHRRPARVCTLVSYAQRLQSRSRHRDPFGAKLPGYLQGKDERDFELPAYISNKDLHAPLPEDPAHWDDERIGQEKERMALGVDDEPLSELESEDGMSDHNVDRDDPDELASEPVPIDLPSPLAAESLLDILDEPVSTPPNSSEVNPSTAEPAALDSLAMDLVDIRNQPSPSAGPDPQETPLMTFVDQVLSTDAAVRLDESDMSDMDEGTPEPVRAVEHTPNGDADVVSMDEGTPDPIDPIPHVDELALRDEADFLADDVNFLGKSAFKSHTPKKETTPSKGRRRNTPRTKAAVVPLDDDDGFERDAYKPIK